MHMLSSVVETKENVINDEDLHTMLDRSDLLQDDSAAAAEDAQNDATCFPPEADKLAHQKASCSQTTPGKATFSIVGDLFKTPDSFV